MKNAVKLVQCRLGKKTGAKTQWESRLVPYQEFELWKFFITHHYGFTVTHEEILLWIPQAEYERKKERFSRLVAQPAIRVTLYFFLKKAGALVSTTRFFPEKEYPKIKPLFLKHFEAFQDENHLTKVLEQVVEKKGVCLKNL